MTSEELLAQMQAKGLIDAALATRLKRDALISGESIESVIAKQRAVDDTKIAELKSVLLKVPYKPVSPADIDAKVLELMPEDTARTYEAIPISLQDNLLIIGMLHPDDQKAQEALKFIARQNHMTLGVYLISYGDWEAVLKKTSRKEVIRL